jgi:hypothetical protein
MDLIYGKRSSDEGDTSNKRFKADTLDLPVHLPNLKPEPDTVVRKQEDILEKETAAEIQEKPAVPIAGTTVKLETQTDIDEWIKQRKANWMKKISNSKKSQPESSQSPSHSREEKLVTSTNQNENSSVEKHNNRRGAHEQRQQDRSYTHNNKFNLNKVIIQRGLSKENQTILDVIRELFDQRVIDKPEA